jgi:hypothetical protein
LLFCSSASEWSFFFFFFLLLLLACWLCVFCVSVEMDDDVAAASEQVQKLWADATQAAQKQLQAIVACESTRDAAALPRMNALVQDRMATLRSLMLRLELIAQQYPTYVCCCCFYYSSELTQKRKKKPRLGFGVDISLLGTSYEVERKLSFLNLIRDFHLSRWK